MIYFISDGSAIKIGQSKNIDSRIRWLGTANAKPLDLIASIDGNITHENKIHSDLAKYRLKGEWFADCADVRSAISQYVESGVSVDQQEPDLGPESEVVERCRVAAEMLITRKMNDGLPKMEAYERVAAEVGTSAAWIRKFIARVPSVKEPRLSVGVALLESAGLLVVGAKAKNSSAKEAGSADQGRG